MNQDTVAGSIKKAGGKVEGMAGEAFGDEKLQADGLVDQARGAAQNAYGQAREAVQDYAGQAYDAAGKLADQGRRYVDEGRRAYPEVERYYRDGRRVVSRHVEESPMAALMVAGAVGYLLALLVHGRR